jgi:peptidoglycan/xylan/chitin deacetylase (PgdA/CDA1 family)
MKIRTQLKYVLALGIESVQPGRSGTLAILTYHSVGAGIAHSTTSAALRQHIRTIQAVPEMEFADWQEKAKPMKRACLFTFDDGYRDNFTCAAPILDDEGVKAIFFITTGFLEGIDITTGFRSYAGLSPMTWDQVGNLLARGHSIGLHGHTHRNFGTMSNSESEDELLTSLELFKRRLGIAPDCFAYPFGQFQHRKPGLAATAASHGIRFIFTTDHRLARLDDVRASSALLPRLRVDADDDAVIVRQKINGAWDFVAAVQRVKSCAATRSLEPFFST